MRARGQAARRAPRHLPSRVRWRSGGGPGGLSCRPRRRLPPHPPPRGARSRARPRPARPVIASCVGHLRAFTKTSTHVRRHAGCFLHGSFACGHEQVHPHATPCRVNAGMCAASGPHAPMPSTAPAADRVADCALLLKRVVKSTGASDPSRGLRQRASQQAPARSTARPPPPHAPHASSAPAQQPPALSSVGAAPPGGAGGQQAPAPLTTPAGRATAREALVLWVGVTHLPDIWRAAARQPSADCERACSRRPRRMHHAPAA
jgi:hypothetical protein